MRSLLFVFGLAACSDPNRDPVTERSVRWAKRALQVDGKGPPTQCATIDAPLWPDEPDGPTTSADVMGGCSRYGKGCGGGSGGLVLLAPIGWTLRRRR